MAGCQQLHHLLAPSHGLVFLFEKSTSHSFVIKLVTIAPSIKRKSLIRQAYLQTAGIVIISDPSSTGI